MDESDLLDAMLDFEDESGPAAGPAAVAAQPLVGLPQGMGQAPAGAVPPSPPTLVGSTGAPLPAGAASPGAASIASSSPAGGMRVQHMSDMQYHLGLDQYKKLTALLVKFQPAKQAEARGLFEQISSQNLLGTPEGKLHALTLVKDGLKRTFGVQLYEHAKVQLIAAMKHQQQKQQQAGNIPRPPSSAAMQQQQQQVAATQQQQQAMLQQQQQQQQQQLAMLQRQQQAQAAAANGQALQQQALVAQQQQQRAPTPLSLQQQQAVLAQQQALLQQQQPARAPSPFPAAGAGGVVAGQPAAAAAQQQAAAPAAAAAGMSPAMLQQQQQLLAQQQQQQQAAAAVQQASAKKRPADGTAGGAAAGNPAGDQPAAKKAKGAGAAGGGGAGGGAAGGGGAKKAAKETADEGLTADGFIDMEQETNQLMEGLQRDRTQNRVLPKTQSNQQFLSEWRVMNEFHRQIQRTGGGLKVGGECFEALQLAFQAHMTQLLQRSLRNAQHRQDAVRRSADMGVTSDPRRGVTQIERREKVKADAKLEAERAELLKMAGSKRADEETKERAQKAKAELVGRQQASLANAAVAATLGGKATGKFNKWDKWAAAGGEGGAAGGKAGAAGKKAGAGAGATGKKGGKKAAGAAAEGEGGAAAGEGGEGGAATSAAGSDASAPAAAAGGDGKMERAGSVKAPARTRLTGGSSSVDDASTVHLRDVMATLERDPLYCRSDLLYRLYNNPRAGPSTVAAPQ